MEGYIHEITVVPDLTAIIALLEMIAIVNQLVDVKTETYEHFVFFYDTTFKLSDFYVSLLAFQNIIFEDSSITPVAFFIYGRKKKHVHSTYSNIFDFVSPIFPKINKKSVPFMTDREIGIVNAIENNFPNGAVLKCWNHLVNDLKYNLQKMRAEQNNIGFYTSNIKELLMCENSGKAYLVVP